MSYSSFVTLAQLASHAGRHPESVRRALKTAGMLPKKIPGVAGHRIKLSDANRFLARQWPGTPAMKEEASA